MGLVACFNIADAQSIKSPCSRHASVCQLCSIRFIFSCLPHDSQISNVHVFNRVHVYSFCPIERCFCLNSVLSTQLACLAAYRNPIPFDSQPVQCEPTSNAHSYCTVGARCKQLAIGMSFCFAQPTSGLVVLHGHTYKACCEDA